MLKFAKNCSEIWGLLDCTRHCPMQSRCRKKSVKNSKCPNRISVDDVARMALASTDFQTFFGQSTNLMSFKFNSILYKNVLHAFSATTINLNFPIFVWNLFQLIENLVHKGENYLQAFLQSFFFTKNFTIAHHLIDFSSQIKIFISSNFHLSSPGIFISNSSPSTHFRVIPSKSILSSPCPYRVSEERVKSEVINEKKTKKSKSCVLQTINR